jgi:hypothetical protein
MHKSGETHDNVGCVWLQKDKMAVQTLAHISQGVAILNLEKLLYAGAGVPILGVTVGWNCRKKQLLTSAVAPTDRCQQTPLCSLRKDDELIATKT